MVHCSIVEAVEENAKGAVEQCSRLEGAVECSMVEVQYTCAVEWMVEHAAVKCSSK